MNEPIVLVPTWCREELLFLCLESVRRESPAIAIHVYSDRGATSPDLRNTCDKFSAHLTVRAQHNFYGNSFNVLDAAKLAMRHRPSLLHVIEDDTIKLEVE